jgi:hypothetical protein
MSKAGRPPLPQHRKRTKRLVVLLTDAEMRSLQAHADMRECSIPELVRRVFWQGEPAFTPTPDINQNRSNS